MQNRGLIIEHKEKDWILGGLPRPIINPSGDWRLYLPDFESQIIDGRDTFACQTFGTLDALEGYAKFLGFNKEWSERFVAILAGVRVGVGGSPQTVAECIRKQGMVYDTALPLKGAQTVEQFYTPDPLPQNLTSEAVNDFLNEWSLSYERVPKGNLIQALKQGVVCVSVYAWTMNADGTYVKNGESDNHWVWLIYGDENFWYICDSDVDSNKIKRLSKDYDFDFAQVYYLTHFPSPKTIPWYQYLIGLYKQVIELIKKSYAGLIK